MCKCKHTALLSVEIRLTLNVVEHRLVFVFSFFSLIGTYRSSRDLRMGRETWGVVRQTSLRGDPDLLLWGGQERRRRVSRIQFYLPPPVPLRPPGPSWTLLFYSSGTDLVPLN